MKKLIVLSTATALLTVACSTDYGESPWRAYSQCDQFKAKHYANDTTARCYQVRSKRIVEFRNSPAAQPIRSWSY